MRRHDRVRHWLTKMAHRRSRQYPLATVAYYGPDDKRASKVVVAIFAKKDDLKGVPDTCRSPTD
jgi:hypothetical protein